MKTPEIQQIVEQGLQTVGMTIESTALSEIVALSKGLPHYTHLLALHSGRQALDLRELVVGDEHVQKAVIYALDQSQESIRTDYDSATYSTKKNTMHETVILACAMASTDDFGRFQPGNVGDMMQRITGEAYTNDRFSKHLKAFCEGKRPALKKSGGEYKWKYRFANPLMQPFVLMKGLSSGRISQTQLRELQGAGTVDPSGHRRLF
jgi:hypothetical protein